MIDTGDLLQDEKELSYCEMSSMSACFAMLDVCWLLANREPTGAQQFVVVASYHLPSTILGPQHWTKSKVYLIGSLCNAICKQNLVES